MEEEKIGARGEKLRCELSKDGDVPFAPSFSMVVCSKQQLRDGVWLTAFTSPREPSRLPHRR